MMSTAKTLKEPQNCKTKPKLPTQRSLKKFSKLKKPTIKKVNSEKTGQSSSHPEYPQLIYENEERLFDLETYKKLQNRAIQAYRDRKIFAIHGNYGRIRQALTQRGWIEKLISNNVMKTPSKTNVRGWRKKETLSLSRLVEKYPSFFIWQSRCDFDQYKYVNPYRNRIRCNRGNDFSTKLGLIKCAENAKWNTIKGVAEVLCPRSYRLDTDDSRTEFLDDFRLTHCLSLLNYLQFVLYSKELCFDINGTIDMNIIDFAIKTIKNRVEPQQKLIELTEEIEEINEEKWSEFIKDSNQIINMRGKFHLENHYLYYHVKEKIQNVLILAQRYWPTLHMDGYHNLWILKPGFQCRGNGIVILQDYNNIVEFAGKRLKYKYIVQKYIEKPLLIYNTKFDIRQYMLVTITDTINIWMYTDCYLRFSSQEYTLNHLRESVHLTNNSVQKKYQNGQRHSQLPQNNMWSLMEFLNYLQSNYNDREIWTKTIYAGMKRNVIGIILSSLDEMQLTTNAFELYGCDFMLDEKFEPMLIEVNSTPDLSASTKVTAKICPTVQDDLIKVVVDLPKNSKTATGNFELIYKMNLEKIVTESKSDLLLFGKKMRLHPYENFMHD